MVNCAIECKRFLVFIVQRDSPRSTVHQQRAAQLPILSTRWPWQRWLRRCAVACKFITAACAHDLVHATGSRHTCKAAIEHEATPRFFSAQHYHACHSPVVGSGLLCQWFDEICCVPTETKDLCRDRAERFEHYPGIERGFGRGFSVHHHGEASTSDMDGWAEQFICNGETKVFAIPAI
jgi:hypothetical protein